MRRDPASPGGGQDAVTRPARPGGGLASLQGREVITGVGVRLGVVVRVARDPQGRLSSIVVRQCADAKEWTIDAEHIQRIGERVWLKGPRQGFHIAPWPAPAETATRPA